LVARRSLTRSRTAGTTSPANVASWECGARTKVVFAVVSMNSVNAEVPFVSLLGDTFRDDPTGFARMLGDILLDGLVIERNG
jgi:hypothetical protein